MPRAVEWPVESDETSARGAVRSKADRQNVIRLVSAPALLMEAKITMGSFDNVEQVQAPLYSRGCG